MKYDIRWTPSAESQLAAIYLAAADANAVTRAVAWFDYRLSYIPLSVGRPRNASVNRTAVHDGLGVEFEVIEDDKRVVVQAVFWAG